MLFYLFPSFPSFFFKQPTVEYIAKDPIIIRLNSPCVVSSPSVNERCALRLLRPHSCLSLFETTSELNDRFEITTRCDKTLSQLSTIQELMKACLWLAETQFTWELYKLNKIFLSRQIEKNFLISPLVVSFINSSSLWDFYRISFGCHWLSVGYYRSF